MQTYVVKFKSFKSVIKPQPLEKIPKNDNRMAMFIPDSRVNDVWISDILCRKDFLK